MAVTYLLTVVTMATVVNVDIESTNMMRALITETAKLLTIFMWNYNNSEVWQYTKELKIICH